MLNYRLAFACGELMTVCNWRSVIEDFELRIQSFQTFAQKCCKHSLQIAGGIILGKRWFEEDLIYHILLLQLAKIYVIFAYCRSNWCMIHDVSYLSISSLQWSLGVCDSTKQSFGAHPCDQVHPQSISHDIQKDPPFIDLAAIEICNELAWSWPKIDQVWQEVAGRHQEMNGVCQEIFSAKVLVCHVEGPMYSAHVNWPRICQVCTADGFDRTSAGHQSATQSRTLLWSWQTAFWDAGMWSLPGSPIELCKRLGVFV